MSNEEVEDGGDDAFVNWTRGSIDLGIECLDVAAGEVLVMLEGDSGKRNIIKIEQTEDDDSVEGRVDAARGFIAEATGSDFYALLWSGQGPNEKGKLIDVIAVEVGSRFGDTVFLTQPYKVARDHSLVKVGGPLVSSARIENIWVQDDVDEEDQESDEDEYNPIDELIEGVFEVVVERLEEANTTPFACLGLYSEEGFEVLNPEAEDTTAEQMIDSLQKTVASNDFAELYAIVSFSTMEMKGKNVNAALVHVGDRDGDSFIFGMPYKISKSGQLKTKEVEFLHTGTNLWVATEE